MTVYCTRGRQATVRTSWTSRNPGRRFYSCPIKGSRCNFFGWFDPEMCQRSMEIIPGLLRAKNELEVKLKASEDELKRMRRCLISSLLCILICVVVVGYLAIM